MFEKEEKSYISGLNIDGLYTMDKKIISNEFYEYRRNLMGNSVQATIDVDWNKLYRNSSPDLSCLDKEFTMGEIRRAVFSLSVDKSPVPDGFSP